MYVGSCIDCGIELDYQDGHTLQKPGRCRNCHKVKVLRTEVDILKIALGWKIETGNHRQMVNIKTSDYITVNITEEELDILK